MADSVSERPKHAHERKNFIHDVTILLPMIQVCGMLLRDDHCVPANCRACYMQSNITHVHSVKIYPQC